ncbi:MAG: hypothetical protein J6U73_02915 [Alistipes sp.]|nr:hypothetical protein [Alistipes sp.]
MTRKFTLFLASMLIAFTAEATMPMIGTTTTDEQPASLTTEESEDDGFWWGASFDMASNYIWRGFDQSYRGGNRNMFDPSLQPGVSFGYGNFYIDLWYNHSLISKYNEFDIYLGYERDNLTITIYDVLWGVGGDDMSTMNPFKGDNHILTAAIDYTFFERLRLLWETTFIHSGDKLINGKQAYSSYFEATYTHPVCDLFDLELTAGASPWSGPFWCYKRAGSGYADSYPEGFNVTNLSLMALKEFELDNFTIPVKAGYIYNPTTEFSFVYMQAGISF